MLQYAPEKIELCLERYGNGIKRVFGVINSHLKKSGRQYLVGDKVSFADLMFVPWHWLLFNKPFLMGEDFTKEVEKDYPEFWAWAQKLDAREAVTKARDARSQAMSKGH